MMLFSVLWRDDDEGDGVEKDRVDEKEKRNNKFRRFMPVLIICALL
jgi:hypothetical protein